MKISNISNFCVALLCNLPWDILPKVEKLMGENLKVVLAEFSTLS
jgi:hypothetical protein